MKRALVKQVLCSFMAYIAVASACAQSSVIDIKTTSLKVLTIFDRAQDTLKKQFEDADSVLSKAITADPENSVLLLSKLKLNYGQQHWAEVKNTGIQLMALGNGSGYVLQRVGIAYYQLKDYPCCLETLADIDNTQQTETSYYIAAMAYKALNRQQDAARYFANAINAGISPNIADYYSQMADSYEILKNYQAAAFAYEKGRQFSEKPITYYLLATLYDGELKNKKMARLYYKKFIDADTARKDKAFVIYAKSRMKTLTVH